MRLLPLLVLSPTTKKKWTKELLVITPSNGVFFKFKQEHYFLIVITKKAIFSNIFKKIWKHIL